VFSLPAQARRTDGVAEEQDCPIAYPHADPAAQRPATAPANWWARILDGQRSWGSIDFAASRQGLRSYRLVVFPPGISDVERRLLRLWQRWPIWGALLWLLVVIPFGGTPSASMAAVAATVVYMGTGATLFMTLGHVRTRVRTLSVVLVAGYAKSGAVATYTELKALVAVLCAADELREQGGISPAQHEAVWWQVYDRLGADGRVPGTTRNRKAL
jgi:hypothetical protein